ncbi:MAG: class IV adenylate cyclase [Methanomicrobiales archaeon]|nr:class IV adenylate cyclase [Methanomicrobiales archaeon]
MEAKIRVQNLASIQARLHQLGARDCGVIRERDVYFNAPHRDFGTTDEALRIRYSEPGNAAMTYKGPKVAGFAAKARIELTVSIDPAFSMEEILVTLGFARVAEVRKVRSYYQLADASVALDRVDGLGTFVEIEASAHLSPAEASATVDRTVKKLGIAGEYIALSYLEMLLAKTVTR